MAVRMALGLLITALALALPVSAEQDRATPAVVEQVPMEVVLRLLDLEPTDRLTLGRIPEELASQIALPADVEVIATISSRSDEAPYDRVKGNSSLPPQELLQALADSLATRGWSPQSTNGAEVTSGFANASGSRDWRAFCGPGDASVKIFVVEKSEDVGTTSFRLFHSPARDGAPCEERPAYSYRPVEPQWSADLVPVLEPPEGAGSTSAGSSGSDEHRVIEALVETDLSPDLLVNHYGGQLVAAEWAVGQTVALSKLAAAEVSAQTLDGVPVSGFLLAKCGQQRQGYCEVALSLNLQRDDR